MTNLPENVKKDLITKLQDAKVKINEEVSRYLTNRASLLSYTQKLVLNEFLERLNDPDRIKEIKDRDLAGIFKIISEQERLERGQSTQNITIANIHKILDNREKGDK